jgi:O-antigen/teichoic acid export membrane protein
VKNSLLKNSFYNTAGGILKIGLGIFTIPLLIRKLGVEEYGLWTLASAVISVVTLAEAGLSTATTVFVAQELEDDNVVGLSQTLTITIMMMLFMATFAAISLWWGGGLISGLFPQLQPLQKVDVSKAFQVGSIAVWARLIQQVLVGVEQAYQRYDLVNLISTLQSLLISVGMLSIAWSGGRTIELMRWQGLASMLILLSHIWIVRSLLRNTTLSVRWSKEKAMRVGKYSFMVWLSSLGGVIFSRVDRLVVGNVLGAHALGIYATITDITGQINGISALPVQPLISVLSRAAVDDCVAIENTKTQVKKAVEVNTFVALFLGGAIMSMAHFIIEATLPLEVNGNNTVIFQIATIIYSIYSLNAVGYYILFGIKAVSTAASIQLVVGLGSLVLIYAGSSQLGLSGAIYGNSGYLGVCALTSFSMKYLKISVVECIGWIKFPLIWFGVLSIIYLVVPYSITFNLSMLAFQSLFILSWFFAKNKYLVNL